MGDAFRKGTNTKRVIRLLVEFSNHSIAQLLDDSIFQLVDCSFSLMFVFLLSNGLQATVRFQDASQT